MGYDWALYVLDKLPLSGIEPHEVMQALRALRRWPRPATGPSRERVLVIAARTRAGRPLLVRIQPVTRWDWVILGAREMTPGQLSEFEAWEAQQ